LDFAIYKYNSIYKLLADALKFDPPQPPFKRGEKKKSLGWETGFLSQILH